MNDIKLTRVCAGYYTFKHGGKEYEITRHHDDSKRWNIECLIDGLQEWQESTWGGLADVRDIIAYTMA